MPGDDGNGSSFRHRILAAGCALAVALTGCGGASRSGRTKATTSKIRTPAGVKLVYRALPTPQSALNNSAVEQAAVIMRERLRYLGAGSGSTVTVSGDLVTVKLAGLTRLDQARAEQLVGTSARLEFYDWEPNVLTPTGKPVASLLRTGDPVALTISQGSGSAIGPGGAGAGSLGIFQAVKLAARQPPYISKTSARSGPEYFLFGRSGSAACTAAAHAVKATPRVGQPCYLAGPAGSPSDLDGGLTEGVTAAEAARASPRTVKVNQGWVVMEAAPKNYGTFTSLANPSAQFYVLRDHVALFGNDIIDPQQSTDQTGQPDVSFQFTGNGAGAFQKVTEAVAKRGALVSGLGQKLFQHFAVALDAQLITVPYIDYQASPFGITGDTGADIQGGFTIRSAQDLAVQLQLGALPVGLELISAAAIRPKPT